MRDFIINQFNIIGEKNNVDILKELENEELESVAIKNFEIDDFIIKKLNRISNLKRLVFLNCKFINSEQLRIEGFLKIENCRGVNKNIFCINNKLNSVYIIQCNTFDFVWLDNLELKKFYLDDVKVKNAEMVEKQTDLESLYLKRINLDAIEPIRFERLKKLKILNLDGSFTINKEEYLKNINENIKVSFKNSIDQLID